MRILMFGWEFPPHNSGGLGVACQGLSRALSEKGEEVIFVLPKKIPVQDNHRFVFAENVFLDVREIDSSLHAYVTSTSYKRGKTKSIYGNNLFSEVLRYAARARDIAKTETFDVIHAHDWLSFPAGMEAARVSGKPLVVHIHATEFDRGGGSINEDVFEIEKEGMEEANHVIAVSEFTKKIIVEKYGIPESKITVVHNGIDTHDYPGATEDDFGISSLKKAGYKIVLFLGRITLQKGPDYFVEAAAKILKFRPKTMFVVVGSGDMEGETMRRSAELGISGNILFVGFLRDEARSRVYHSADAYVMPSVSEPFGITALESLLHGTPVVMSKQCGAGEVVLHALKSDFWDTDEIADKVISVLSYPAMGKEMTENGTREVKNCTWDRAAERLQHVYNNITP